MNINIQYTYCLQLILNAVEFVIGNYIGVQ